LFRFIIVSFLVTAVTLAMLLVPGAPENTRAVDTVTTHDTFETEEQVVTLTFDVTFDRGDAVMILDTLRDRDVVSTWAITGRWARDNPDLMQRIVDDGHHLMNHTWDHFSFTGEYTGSTIHQPTDPLSRGEVISQLQRTEQIVMDQVGVDLKPYVRPPYGDYNQDTLAAFAEAGYTENIMWTVDTLGWYGHPVWQVQQRALDAAQPGANILMHVGHGATDGAALPGIIDGYREMGYQFATVEDFVEGNLARSRTRYFEETGHEVSGVFLRYWERYGAISLLGYPVSSEFEDEDGMLVQYFERARLEYQPGTWPERMDVHMTRLGAEATRDRRDEDAFLPVQGADDDHCNWYEQTGHTLCGGFRDFWEDNGGLAVFGYPISQEFREFNRDTGETHVVQYFERQRFEWHPGRWPERHDVLLGRLGAEAYDARDDVSE
jgi:peptidoglycan/xylan/chitin deacetylase (PgdA/CDA1 family)